MLLQWLRQTVKVAGEKRFKIIYKCVDDIVVVDNDTTVVAIPCGVGCIYRMNDGIT